MQKLKLATYGLTLTTALVLTACGGGGSDPAPQPETFPANASQIHGQLQPWNSQWAGSVMPVNAAIEHPGADFKTPVTAAGKFDLQLPGAATMNSTYASDLMTLPEMFSLCEKLNVTGAPADLKISPINKLQTDTGKTLVASSNGGTTFKTWWYANKDASVHIVASGCTGFTATDSTLNLKAGWNVIDQKITTPNSAVILTYTNAAAPTTRVVWTEQGSAMGPMSLSGDFLQPWGKRHTAQ